MNTNVWSRGNTINTLTGNTDELQTFGCRTCSNNIHSLGIYAPTYTKEASLPTCP